MVKCFDTLYFSCCQTTCYDGDLLTSIVDARQVSVLRDGEAASVYIPEDMMNRLLADSVRFASFRFPYVAE